MIMVKKMTVGDIPCGYWFKLERNGSVYYKIAKGEKGYHSLCLKLDSDTAWNMSNQSHASLVRHRGKPKMRKFGCKN